MELANRGSSSGKREMRLKQLEHAKKFEIPAVDERQNPLLTKYLQKIKSLSSSNDLSNYEEIESLVRKSLKLLREIPGIE